MRNTPDESILSEQNFNNLSQKFLETTLNDWLKFCLCCTIQPAKLNFTQTAGKLVIDMKTSKKFIITSLGPDLKVCITWKIHICMYSHIMWAIELTMEAKQFFLLTRIFKNSSIEEVSIYQKQFSDRLN